jgi:hypothetical protein
MAENASPDSFCDANQGIYSPEGAPSPARTMAPQGVNFGVITRQEGRNTSGDSSTPSPLQQRQLFRTEANNNNPNDDGTAPHLCRHLSSNAGQESLDMSDVAEERKEAGDNGDSAAEAVDTGELDSCFDECP